MAGLREDARGVKAREPRNQPNQFSCRLGEFEVKISPESCRAGGRCKRHFTHGYARARRSSITCTFPWIGSKLSEGPA